MAEYFGSDTPKLGFGMMRLPRKGPRIDVDATAEMVDMFLDAGMSYFDTARIYPGSETATRKALVERHPRESFTIATKLYAPVAPTAGIARGQIETSLRKLGVDYVDYYLLHTLMESNSKKYERLDLWDWARELKREGKVRHWGFSFHGTPALLDRLLTENADAEFVQLQLNYRDWEDAGIASRACYEVARAHDVSIVVMEPVKGGQLADPPREVAELLRAANPDASPASWAIRFAASLDGIITVLSGMSNRAQMADNLSFMRDFKPLDEAEREVIRKAQELLGKSAAIGCTACGYCTTGCPQSIPIPKVFAAMNDKLSTGRIEAAREAYAQAVATAAPASACIECGQCEAACPQHLPVIKLLAEAAATFE